MKSRMEISFLFFAVNLIYFCDAVTVLLLCCCAAEGLHVPQHCWFELGSADSAKASPGEN